MSLCQGSGLRRDIDFLKAKRNWNRETEQALTRNYRILSLSGHRTSGHNAPSELSECLFKCSPLEATHNEEFGRFRKILLRFSQSSSLGGNVQRGAMGHVPAVLSLNDAEKLQLCLEYQTHIFTIGALSTICDAS